MANDPAFQIVICTRNRAPFLDRCLEALIPQAREFYAEVVIVDNGSTDGTAAVLEKYRDNILILHEPKVGLSNARNAAIEHCRADYIAFLDDDGIPDQGWVAAIAQIAHAGIADIFGGPYTPYYTVPKQPWFADDLGSAHLDLRDGPVEPPTCFSGGNMGWRTSLVRQAGGFDPLLGMSDKRVLLGEETALQIKLHAGHPNIKVVFASRMSMTHHVSPEKMSLRYIFKRNFIYGRQLKSLDPGNPLNRYTLVRMVRETRAFAPLLYRAVRRDRARFPYWKAYAAQNISLNAILLGAQVGRMLRKLSPKAGPSDAVPLGKHDAGASQ